MQQPPPNQNDLKFELEGVFLSDAADILAAREKARMMHHGRDIRAAGDEVEIAFRKVLGRKLPSLYYVGHGHMVDEQLHQSSQLDVIIANNTGAPILFRAENGSEYFPYEGVYAIGEVKSSYDNSENYIHKFSDNLKRIQDQLQREPFQATVAFWLSPPAPTGIHSSPSCFLPMQEIFALSRSATSTGHGQKANSLTSFAS